MQDEDKCCDPPPPGRGVKTLLGSESQKESPGKSPSWKSKFLYRYRPEGIFQNFFGLILDPPRYICLYNEKRQIHLYRPFFSPWHGLFRKKGGTGAGIRCYFPCRGSCPNPPPPQNKSTMTLLQSANHLLFDSGDSFLTRFGGFGRDPRRLLRRLLF